MILGITGTTGSGKTTLLHAFSEIGGIVFDCDRIYHELLAQDSALRNAINTRFPGCVENGQLNRKTLAAIVFADPKALLDLNAITHKAVKAEILRRLESLPGDALVAIDAIELFDGGLAELCHTTVAVTAPEEIRVERLTSRDNLTRAQALSRIRAQKPESYFKEKCDYVLENTGTPEQFHQKCLVFFRTLTIIKENPKGE